MNREELKTRQAPLKGSYRDNPAAAKATLRARGTVHIAEQTCDVESEASGPVLRAGFTDVLVTGMLIRWMSVSPRPMAMGANPAGARLSVAPSMMIRNINVITTSQTRPALSEYWPGECSP